MRAAKDRSYLHQEKTSTRYTKNMRYETILMVLGLLTAIVPILGIPTDWRQILSAIIGIAVFVIALIVRGWNLRDELPEAEEFDMPAE